MSDENNKHKIELLATLTRRKNMLELQVAKLGVNADPSLSLEIEELDAKIVIEGNWMQDLDDHYGAIVECITKVREYAKFDLLSQ